MLVRGQRPPPQHFLILATTLDHDQLVQIDRHNQIGTVMLELTRLGPIRGAYEASTDATLRRDGRSAQPRRGAGVGASADFQALSRPTARKDNVTAAQLVHDHP